MEQSQEPGPQPVPALVPPAMLGKAGGEACVAAECRAAGQKRPAPFAATCFRFVAEPPVAGTAPGRPHGKP